MSTRIAVLVSGGGTNLQALIDAQLAGKFKDGYIAAVISTKEGGQNNIKHVKIIERASRGA